MDGTAGLRLKVRRAREMTDPGVENREEHFIYGELEWVIPPAEAALVLVDCWADFPVRSFTERVSRISEEAIRPALEACRRAGVAVIHAPSPEWAANYPEHRVECNRPSAPPAADDWPPPALRRVVHKQSTGGPFFVPRCGDESAYQAWWQRANPHDLRIVPCLEPVRGEAVVATGIELHEVCRQRRLQHLIYAGFATNICIRHRDYGMDPMYARGYNLILLRDATTGVEFGDSLAGQWMTRAAIHYVELKMGVTALSTDLQRACHELDR